MKISKDKLVDAIGKIDDEYVDEASSMKKKGFVFSWALTGKILTGVLCLLLVVTIIPNFFRMGAAYKTEESVPAEAYDTNGYEVIGGVGGIGGTGSYLNDESVDYSSAKDYTSVVDNKKLIVTGHISIETLDFDELIANLNKNVAEYGGYIQNSSINTNRYETRNYDATIRIPADKYEEFLNKTKEVGNVTWYSESIDDITDTYIDLQARLNSLKTEESKVLEFYDKAENLDELMSVENRLTDIRYEIDSIETRIKNYDLLINYSTLNISVYETKAYTKTNDNFVSRLSLSFRNGFTNFVNSIENFALDIVYNIWSIVLVAIIVVVVIVVIKKVKKNRK